MDIAVYSKKDFIAMLRDVKQQKREREKQLQHEWAELQKRAMSDTLGESGLGK